MCDALHKSSVFLVLLTTLHVTLHFMKLNKGAKTTVVTIIIDAFNIEDWVYGFVHWCDYLYVCLSTCYPRFVYIYTQYAMFKT